MVLFRVVQPNLRSPGGRESEIPPTEAPLHLPQIVDELGIGIYSRLPFGEL